MALKTRTRPAAGHATDNSARHGVLYYWLPAIAWLALQALFSSGIFTSANTGRTLAAVLSLLHLHLSTPQLLLADHVIRKCAHFTTYGIMSWLMFRAARGSTPEDPRGHLMWTIIALGITLLAATSDEIHQIFVRGRTPAWQDVLLDMTGATFAQIIIYWRARRADAMEKADAR